MMDSLIQAVVITGFTGMLCEFVVLFVTRPSIRRILYGILLVGNALFSVTILIVWISVPVVLVALFGVYRIVNAIRMLFSRMHEQKSLRVTNRTSRFLLVYQLISFGLWWLGYVAKISTYTWIFVLSVISVVGGVIFVLTIIRNLRRMSPNTNEQYISNNDLPSVSVCIPARNETQDLPQVLASVLASDYPKLEILVLDDCSHDKTSEIIKGFAHDGVRFISGDSPRNGWLAKNQAYQTLADASSSPLILFCGVDTRFESTTIRALVGTMKARNKQMVSLMPLMKQTGSNAHIIQPVRYWWELALPRRLFNRPPILSTCWIIEKSVLQSMGGFQAVDNNIVPEAYFARELVKSDTYSFLRSSGFLIIHTAKMLDEQFQTGIRMRYPQLHKRLENVALVTVTEIILFLLPLTLFCLGFFTSIGWMWPLAGLSVLCLSYTHFRVVQACGLQAYSLSIALLPLAVIVELGILHISMWRYELGTIKWKDRNICIPVMRYYRHLPRIE